MDVRGRVVPPFVKRPPDRDQWLRIVEASWKPIAAIAVPVVVALAPNLGSSFTNDRKVDSIIIQEALSVLRKPPANEDDKSVRDWAIAVVENLSGQGFSREARNVLRETPGPISQTAVNPDPISPTEIAEAREAAARVGNGKMIDIALNEVGQSERLDGMMNPRIEVYNASAGLQHYDETVPWNSQFINWVVEAAGYTGTRDARSRSWEKWGKDSLEEVGEFIPGCILVAWRVSPNGWTGISGFYTGRQEGDRYRIVGGNIYNSVNGAWIEQDKVVTCRVPPDWKGPAQ